MFNIMNENSFRKSCNEITEQIKQIGKSAVIDGVIDIECYLKSPIKVMWILKETNSEGGWSIIDNYKDHKWLTAYNGLMSIRRVIYASYGINHPEIKDWKDFPWSYEEECQTALKNIAFININKLPGSSVADDNMMQDAYYKNRALLKELFNFNDDDIPTHFIKNIYELDGKKSQFYIHKNQDIELQNESIILMK